MACIWWVRETVTISLSTSEAAHNSPDSSWQCFANSETGLIQYPSCSTMVNTAARRRAYNWDQNEKPKLLKTRQVNRDCIGPKVKYLKQSIEEYFPPFQNIKGRFWYAVDWAGDWKENKEKPCCCISTKQAKPRNFWLEKFAVLLRRASIVTRRSLVDQIFRTVK